MNHSDYDISIGVSACLTGAEVRYDGGHKKNDTIMKLFSDFFTLETYCPELAIGMGVPRKPIRLVDINGHIRVLSTVDDSLDYTEDLKDYGLHAATKMKHLSGFIFKKDSPSCGVHRVKVFSEKNMPVRRGRGAFAEVVIKQQALLPVEEEGRLNDPVLRENFINRVYVYTRWKMMLADGLSRSALIEFHTQHKYLLLAHDQEGYRHLGRLIAALKLRSLAEIADEYIEKAMQILSCTANRKTHVNVLQHLMGFLKNELDKDDKQELLDTITAYGRGEYPLAVPIMILQHHFRKNPNEFASQQVYLDPYPREFMLRNFI